MNVLPIGDQVPRRGNRFSRWLGRFFLRLLGWRLQGAIPDEPRMVLIGAPHTSNMDGVLAIATLTALGLRSVTMIKDTAFRGILGPVLRWFGAIPVDRSSPKGVVEQTVDAFRRQERLVLLITPEGTRTSAPEWKRGFYHIAVGAQAPILPGAVDYERRVITFGPPVWPSGDYGRDLRILLEFFREHGAPRHPERMSRPLCEIFGVAWRPRPGPGARPS